MLRFEGFQFEDLLGHGSFGTSFVARRTSDGKQFCVKTTPLKPKLAGPLELRVGELAFPGSGLSEYVSVCLYGTQEVWVLSSLVDDSISIREMIDTLRGVDQKGPDSKVVAGLLKQILQQLVVLHSNNANHGLLHASNVLIDSSGNVTLTDYGIFDAVMAGVERDHGIASLHGSCSKKSRSASSSDADVESFAALGRFIVPSEDSKQSLLDGTSDLLEDLLLTAERTRNGRRWSAKELLRHPLFSATEVPPLAWYRDTHRLVCSRRAKRSPYDPSSLREIYVRSKLAIDLPVVSVADLSFESLLKSCDSAACSAQGLFADVHSSCLSSLLSPNTSTSAWGASIIENKK